MTAMRICVKNPKHRRLGATHCETPGCGGLVREIPDPPEAVEAGPPHRTDPSAEAEENVSDDGFEAQPESEDALESEPPIEEPIFDAKPKARVTSKVAAASDAGKPAKPRHTTRVTAPSERTEPTLPSGLEWPWGFVPLTQFLGIGRDPAFSQLAAELRSFPALSRRHAEIRRSGTTFVLRDLGSKNGTFIDDQPLQPGLDVELRDGAVIRFGKELSVKVRRGVLAQTAKAPHIGR